MMSKSPFVIALLVLLALSFFTPSVTSAVTPTPIEPTPVEPTPIEPTKIEPTPIEPTPIEPTPIKPTPIKPTKVKPTTIKPTPIEPTPIEPLPPLTKQANGFFEMAGSMTLMNEYTIGDRLKSWMDSTMASGSPAFFNVGGTFFFPLDREGTMHLGVGMSLNVPPSHGVWGTSWIGFTRREFHLDPYILSVDAPFRLTMADMGMSFTVTPSILTAFCYGGYTGSIGSAPFSHYDTTAMGVGFGLSAGMQFYFDDNFGMDAKVGMRMLNASIAMDAGSYGSLTPADGDGDIPLDLGGTYMTVGMLFKIG